MRSVIHFVGYNLKRLFSSPRLYIAFLVVFAGVLLCFGGARSYLIDSNEMVQAVELFVFANGSWVSQLVFTLGLLLLLGDAPFLKEGISFHLVRTSRSRWVWGQILSCIVIVVIYLLLIEVMILLIFFDCSSFHNKWSNAITLASQLGNGMVINIEMAIGFPMHVLEAGSPWSIFGLTFLYDMLLYIFFCMVLMVCNLRCRMGVGGLVVTLFLVLKLVLNCIVYIKPLWYLSPCNLACIQEETFTYSSILYTVMFFLVLICCLGLLTFHYTQNNDLLKEG